MGKFLTICMMMGISGALHAQKSSPIFDTTRAHELNDVVVTGQYAPQSIKKSVYQVRVITGERIRKSGATKVQDVLNYELNFRFSQDLATGGSNMTMMGLSGQNIKILIDGLPMTGRQGANNSIDINQVDVNSIERIEMVEGPMSVMYGADALGGVINIITRKAAGKQTWNVRAMAHEETIGDEYGLDQGIHNQSLNAAWQKGKWQAGIGAAHNYNGGWKDTAIGREMVWHPKDQRFLNGFVGFRGKDFSLQYRLDGLDEVITNPGNYTLFDPQSGDTFAVDQEYLSKRLMHQLQGNYIFNQKMNVLLQSTYTDYERQVFSTTVSKGTGNVYVNTAPGSQSTVAFTGFTFRSALNYRFNTVWAIQPGIDINTETGEGERLKEGTNSIQDYAFFMTAEFTPGQHWHVRPGVRVVKNSQYQAPPVIPSLNIKYVLNDKSDIKLSYARGFRAPSLRELYLDFFDASHQIMGNPNLEAETSHSVTGSFTRQLFKKEKTSLGLVVNGFYNSIQNKIDYAVSPIDPNVTTLMNVDESGSGGGNLNLAAVGQNWNLSAGFGYTGFYNDYSKDDDELPVLQWSPEVNTVAGYSFSSIGLDANLFYKFTGKRPYYTTSGQETVLASLEGYHMADFTLNKTLGKWLVLNAGIRNLFNEKRVNSTVSASGAHASSGAQYIGTGRGFFAGLRFAWTK